MTREQKELLYEITNWRSKEFYNDMVDHWTTKNYDISTKCRNMINELEKEYAEKYGDLPEWKYIYDVWNTMGELKEELNG